MNTELLHQKLFLALTKYDQRESRKRFHNPYAMGHYCIALQHADKLMAAGRTPRQAILGTFCGRLLDTCLRAIGEAPATSDEQLNASWTREEL